MGHSQADRRRGVKVLLVCCIRLVAMAMSLSFVQVEGQYDMQIIMMLLAENIKHLHYRGISL